MADANKQAIRLAWLKKNRPKDPEIKKLQKAVGGTPTTGGPVSTQRPVDMNNVESFLGGIFDNFKMPDYSGAPQILSAGDLEKSRLEEENIIYGQETKYNDRNRARDLEERKQELANRGIVYDPANPESGYSKQVGAVTEQYNEADQMARDKARTVSGNSLAQKAAVNKAAYDSFIDTATKSFTSQLDTVNAGNNVLNTLMTKYGYSQEAAQRELDRRMQEKIARIQKAPSGNGGSSGGNQGGGFQLPD